MNAPDLLLANAAMEFRRERDQAERTGATPSPQISAIVRRRTVGICSRLQEGPEGPGWRELLTANFPPRSLMLAPWLPDKGLAMIFAPRGVGKTWIALSIAHAIASGSEFLRWRAPGSRRVLYIDGEMPAVTLQERYTTVVAASMIDAPAENFRLVAADFQPDGLPDLADNDAQRFYEFGYHGRGTDCRRQPLYDSARPSGKRGGLVWARSNLALGATRGQ